MFGYWSGTGLFPTISTWLFRYVKKNSYTEIEKWPLESHIEGFDSAEKVQKETFRLKSGPEIGKMALDAGTRKKVEVPMSNVIAELSLAKCGTRYAVMPAEVNQLTGANYVRFCNPTCRSLLRGSRMGGLH